MEKGIFQLNQGLIRIQLNVMLTMQDALNKLVLPDWTQRKLPWHRAIYVEAAEYLEHLGTWKWWKKGTPRLSQAQMELVDIWHFGLAWHLDRMPVVGSYAPVVDALVIELTRACEYLPPLAADELAANEQRHLWVDRLVEAAGRRQFNLEAFVRLLDYSGMSFDALYQHYVGKNVLNRFRQENGYKTGTYVKTWAGLEDNEHLEKLLGTLPVDDTLPEKVHAELSRLYHYFVK